MEVKKSHLVLALILLLQLAIHVNIGTSWFFQDEETFLSYGWFATKGIFAHRDYSEVRPPTFIFFVGAVFSVFGDSLATIRLAMAIVAMASTMAVYLFSLRLFGNPAAIISASLFVMFAPYFGSFMVLSDTSLLLFGTLSFIIFLQPGESQKKDFATGLAAGLSTAIRQNGIAFLAGILLLMILEKRKKDMLPLKRLAPILLGFVLPGVLLVFFYSVVGGLEIFITNSTFGLFGHASSVTASRASDPTPFLQLPVFPLLASSAIALFFLLKTGKKEERSWATVAAVFTTVALTNVVPNPSPYHFIVPLAGFSILIGWAIANLPSLPSLTPKISLIAVLFLLFSGLFPNIVTVFSPQQDVALYGLGKFNPVIQYMREQTSENDRVQFLPHWSLYYRAKRLPASYYASFVPNFGALEAESTIRDIEREKPRYIVSVVRPNYHIRLISPELDDYLATHYHSEKSFGLDYNSTAYVLRRN